MTKFDDLMDIITSNKNKDKNKKSIPESNTIEPEDDVELDVSGSESTRAPLVATASEDLDPDIIDMLYT